MSEKAIYVFHIKTQEQPNFDIDYKYCEPRGQDYPYKIVYDTVSGMV